METKLKLDILPLTTLRQIAAQFRIDGRTKKELVKNMESHYYDLKKYMSYTYIKQLGFSGKDGRTFLATDSKNNEYAVKIFKDSKSPARIEKEIEMQNIASSYGISPRILDYCTHGRYIVMEVLETTLYHMFVAQKYKLTKSQQKKIIRLFRDLDRCGIFHADPNPLNFMIKDSKWYAIDFGFSKKINSSVKMKHSDTPNIKYMPLGLFLKLREVNADCQLEI